MKQVYPERERETGRERGRRRPSLAVAGRAGDEMSDSCSVRVYCRFRPFNDRERAIGADQAVDIKIEPERIVIQDPSSGRPRSFPMDAAFRGDCRQIDVFDTIARPSVDDIFLGYNGTIFAYGQTGSGKSWSMMGGDKHDEELKGIIPRSAELIFEKAFADQTGTTYQVACSYLEVYKEIIGDLLDPSKRNLQVREKPGVGMYVEGLTQRGVANMDEVMELLALGDATRAVASTNMNQNSSRSHSVFILHVLAKTPEGGTKSGKLNLVDLAGSEKISKTGATGETLEEAKKINQSLSALGMVIKAIADGKTHVPYRDSKLTRILQEALGGNSKTSLLVAASPHLDNIEETISTLRFAERAKKIKNVVTANEEKSVAELNAIIHALKKENEGLKEYAMGLENALREAGIDPSTVAPVDMEELRGDGADGRDPPLVLGASSSGGGISAEAVAQMDRLNELLRIANEEKEQAWKERDDAQATIEATYAEGRELIQAAQQEKQDLEKQRQQEREIVKQAMTQLKSLQIQVGEKDAVIQKALDKMKELNGQCARATQAQQAAEASSRQQREEKDELTSKVRELQNQLAKATASLAVIAESAGADGGSGAQTAAAAALQQLQAAAPVPAPAPPPQQVIATIPDDAEPGSTFEVTLPSGETAVAIVPDGAMAGEAREVTATVPVAAPVAVPPIAAVAGGGSPRGGGQDVALAAMMSRVDAQEAELKSAVHALDVQRAKAQELQADLDASRAQESKLQRASDEKMQKMVEQMARMHADTEEASKRMEEKDAAIREAEAKLVDERALHEEVSTQQQKVIESLQLAMQAKDEKQGAGRNMVKTLESNTAAASMRSSLGAVPAQEPPPITGGDRGPETSGMATPGGASRTSEVPTQREYRDFDTVSKKEKKSSTSWFGLRSAAKEGGEQSRSWADAVSDAAAKAKGLLGMAEEEEEEQRPQPMMPLPHSVTCVITENGVTQPAKRFDGAKTKMHLPPHNTEIEAECSTLLEYLDRMHSNLHCLSSSYETYLEAVRQLDQAAEGLAEPLWAFAGVHAPAKVLFTIIAQTTSAQKEQLEMAQGVLESTVRSFWTSTDAIDVKNGTLKNMVTGASNDYNVAMAKALANTRPEKYEAALQGAAGAKCAAAKHNVNRWNYISTLERLAQERELETNRLFSRFLDAQCEIADLNRIQHEKMIPEIEKAQEQIKHDTAMMRRMAKAQQQYQLRLSLKIDRTQLDSEAEQLPGVTFTAHTAEGLVFMQPNVLSGGTAVNKMKVPCVYKASASGGAVHLCHL